MPLATFNNSRAKDKVSVEGPSCFPRRSRRDTVHKKFPRNTTTIGMMKTHPGRTQAHQQYPKKSCPCHEVAIREWADVWGTDDVCNGERGTFLQLGHCTPEQMRLRKVTNSKAQALTEIT